jgi:drug/metabolite transporter (DMT)-like permease
MMNHYGEIAGVLTAVCWTVTAMAFQVATRRVGSLVVNISRLLIAMVIYMAYSRMMRGMWLPVDADATAWKWLSVSGLVGFVLGDYALFKSYSYMSAKISMLIMTLAPPVAALFGFIILGEGFSLMNGLGMMLVISGIALVILRNNGENGKKKLNYPVKGLLYALGGAVGQGIGAVLSKLGMGGYDPFASSQIRVIAGIVGFGLVLLVLRKWKSVTIAARDPKTVKPMIIGAFFGPFLGVSLSMIAFQNTTVGVASTLMATVPVFILLPSVMFFGEKLHAREVIGAFIAVGGIAVFFV